MNVLAALVALLFLGAAEAAQLPELLSEWSSLYNEALHGANERWWDASFLHRAQARCADETRLPPPSAPTPKASKYGPNRG